jgi:hypothetical protein
LGKEFRKIVDNIINSQHRIKGLTPENIKEAYENDDKDILEKAFDTELKKKKVNISK